MKGKILSMLLATMPIVGFIACDDDDDDNNNSETPINILHSGNSECLGSPYDVIGKDDTITNGYCDYEYNAASGTLKLIVSSSQNCGSVPSVKANFVKDSIKVSLDVPKGMMIIDEEGDTLYVPTNCDCLYADTLILNNLAKKNYILNVSDDLYKGNAELNITAKKNIKDRVYMERIIKQ